MMPMRGVQPGDDNRTPVLHEGGLGSLHQDVACRFCVFFCCCLLLFLGVSLLCGSLNVAVFLSMVAALCVIGILLLEGTYAYHSVPPAPPPLPLEQLVQVTVGRYHSVAGG